MSTTAERPARPALPDVPLPEPAALPPELRESEAFILWRAEWEWNHRRGKWKLNKVPCDWTGRATDMTDPAIRGGLDDSLRGVAALRSKAGRHFGVGLTFCAADGFVALDLDGDVVGPTERYRWLVATHPTWTETSVSGRGVHLFYRGRMAGKQKFPWRGSDLEVFGSAGFVALTGQAADGCPGELADGSVLLKVIQDERPGKAKPGTNGSHGKATATDAEILQRMFASRDGDYIRELWAGRGPEDVSAGDLALANYLAFWCGGPDAETIDRLFRQSDRIRPKWDENHSQDGRTYGRMTIDKALRDRSDYWRPEPKPSFGAKSGEQTRDGKQETGARPPGVFEFERLSGLRAKPVKWLVPGRVPFGKVTLIGADGGSGKSTLTRHLAANVTASRAAFGLDYVPPDPGTVILCSAEDSFEEVVVPHLIAEGADLDRITRVFHLREEGNGKRSKVHLGLEHIAELAAELERRRDVQLIVVDPIASFVGRCRINDNQGSELRTVMDPLVVLAERTGAAIIVVAHLNKSNAERAAHKIAGSTQYVAAVRLAYLVGIDPTDQDRRLLLPVKANLLGVERKAAAFGLERLTVDDAAAFRNHQALADLSDPDFREVVSQMARVRFEDSVDTTADVVMGTGRRDRQDPNKVARCTEWLKTFLAEFAYPSQEIVEAGKEAGFTFDNVKEAKARLKADGLRNSNRGQVQGEWWSGFGDPRDWKRRPAPGKPPTPEAPTTGTLPTMPDSPQSPQSDQCGETRERGETKETEEKKDTPKGKRRKAASVRRGKKRLQGRGDDRDALA